MDHNQEYIGLDVGAVRVGVARGSGLARIAEPLKTLAADKAIEEINALAKDSSAAGIVVGLPRNLQGSETAQTQAVRAWVLAAQSKIDLPFYWQDEALTSQIAERQKPSAKAPGPDAQAAAIILQDFLDSSENDRVAA